MIKFLNCKIALSKKVFQPRIETEFWVKKVLRELQGVNRELEILDIFAGTGCIGIAILKNIKNSKVDFTDISKDAIAEIKINLKLNGIEENRYKIYQSNLFGNIKNKKYDFIFANPPYVALERIKEVDEEVLEKEPKEALFAGRDGMLWVKRFFSQVRKYIKENGKIFMEFDPKQKVGIKKNLKGEKFKFQFKKDQFKKFRWLKIFF